MTHIVNDDIFYFYSFLLDQLMAHETVVISGQFCMCLLNYC